MTGFSEITFHIKSKIVTVIISLMISISTFAQEITLDSNQPSIINPYNSAGTSSYKQPNQFETITIYQSNFLPGFRPCTPEDYRKQDRDPIACQDDDVARVLTTREENRLPKSTIVRENSVPQSNIYQLRFERFKRKKK